MYDILIVGGGAAGLSAAVTARARNKAVLIISGDISTSAIYKAERIDNYLGFHNISGKEMLDAFEKHGEKMGVERKKGRALQIMPMGRSFSVSVGEDIYQAKTVILATGIKKSSQIKGEQELIGKGVSYCATCDGMLYRGKTVVVSGETEEALTDANFLSEICEKVTLVTKKDFGGRLSERVEMRSGVISEIAGSGRVQYILMGDEKIDCHGVFLIGDSIPAEALVYGLELADGIIVANKKMETNIKGVFAAGDCTGRPFQISKAVGEGLVAALSACEYIGSGD